MVQSIYFSAAERVRAFFLPTTPLHPTDDSPMPSFEKNHFLKCSIIDRNKIGIFLVFFFVPGEKSTFQYNALVSRN